MFTSEKKIVKTHNFHIPVMGISFTIDTPLKVAPYGISSVISLGDDLLTERMREFYCQKLHLPFHFVTRDEIDYRAKRINFILLLEMKLIIEQKELRFI